MRRARSSRPLVDASSSHARPPSPPTLIQLTRSLHTPRAIPGDGARRVSATSAPLPTLTNPFPGDYCHPMSGDPSPRPTSPCVGSTMDRGASWEHVTTPDHRAAPLLAPPPQTLSFLRPIRRCCFPRPRAPFATMLYAHDIILFLRAPECHSIAQKAAGARVHDPARRKIIRG